MPDTVAESQAATGGAQQATGDPAAKIASAFHATNSSKNGLSSAEAKRRLAQYGRNALEDRTESKWHKLLSYFWGPLPFLIEAAAVISALRSDWPDFAVVTGLLLYNAARRLLAGQQGGECACGVEEGFGAARPRLARQPMGHGRRRRACTGRCRQRYRGSNRSGRSYPDRWQVSELRSGVADRRVVAGCEEGRRRGLFGQHRQTRGDDGRGHRDRQQDLLRPHREACRRGGRGFPFAARSDAGRRLSAAARLAFSLRSWSGCSAIAR